MDKFPSGLCVGGGEFENEGFVGQKIQSGRILTI